MTKDEQELNDITLAEWLASNSKADTGHKCKKCGCRRNIVWRTTQDVERNATYRERICDYCGNVFSTTEKNQGQTP